MSVELSTYSRERRLAEQAMRMESGDPFDYFAPELCRTIVKLPESDPLYQRIMAGVCKRLSLDPSSPRDRMKARLFIYCQNGNVKSVRKIIRREANAIDIRDWAAKFEKEELALTLISKFLRKRSNEPTIGLLKILFGAGIGFIIGIIMSWYDDLSAEAMNELKKLQKVFGSELFRFEENDPRNKVLILRTTADHNSAFSLARNSKIIFSLNEKFDLRYVLMTSLEDVWREIRTYGQNLTGLLLRAHGFSEGMLVAPSSFWDLSTPIRSDLFEEFSERATIVLDSCSTANPESNPNFAERIAQAAQRIVIAPKEDAVTRLSSDISTPDQLAFRFQNRLSQDITAVVYPGTVRPDQPTPEGWSTAILTALQLLFFGYLIFSVMRPETSPLAPARVASKIQQTVSAVADRVIEKLTPSISLT